ncbi:hypothetical protein D3C80_1754330 [compost metagenome]
MVERKSSPHIKDCPERIQDTPSHKQRHAASSHRCRERIPGDDDQPTHSDVKDRRHEQKFFDEESFEQHSEKCHSPDDAEQAPAQCSADRHQQERRVGAGNKQINRGMVQEFE